MKFLILLTLSFLAACSAKQTADTQLTVSRSFISTGGYSGGLIIYGENLDTRKSFSFPLVDGLEKRVSLEVGKWRFGAVAWDGYTKFTGKTYCAQTLININGQTTVDLNASESECNSTAFAENFALKNLLVKSCDILRKYDKATDSFQPIDSDSYCDPSNSSKPEFLKSPLLYYRVFPVDTLTTNLFSADTLGEPSSCIAQFSTPARIALPTQKIPFHIKMYKSYDDCVNSSDKTSEFRFGNGIKLGAPLRFDHHYAEDTGTTNARLVMPSSVTQRGYSPFMNMIPRVLCSGGSDCFTDLNLTNHNVDWKDDPHYKTLFTNVSAGACSSLSYPTSNYFNVSGCKVENGSLKALIKRNELMCQNGRMYQLNPSQTIVGMYYKNDKLFILRVEAGSSINRLDVYTHSGLRINTLELVGTGYSGVAVDNNEKVYIAGPSSVKIYQLDATGNFIALSSLPITSAVGIDVTPDGKYLFHEYHGTTIYSYDILNGAAAGTLSIPNTVKKMQWHNNVLYVMIAGSSMWRAQYSSGSFSNSTSGSEDQNNMGTFTMDRTRLVTKGYDSDDGEVMVVYDTTNTGPYIAKDDYDSYVNSPWNNGNIFVSDNNGTLYYALNGTQIQVFKSSGGYSYPQVNSNSGDCGESSFTITADSKTKTLNLRTTSNASAFNIANAAYDIFGYRYISSSDYAKFSFDVLNDTEDDHKNGGQLRQAQQMLSPTGLAGLLSEFENCSALRNHVATLSGRTLKKRFALQDNFENEAIVGVLDVSIPVAGTKLDSYVCDDTTDNFPSCGIDYSLILNLSLLGDNRVEKMVMKLYCDKKLGTLETYEKDLTKTSQTLTLWNTTNTSAARFEKYKYYYTSSEHTGDVYKVAKSTADNFWARDLHVKIASGASSASVRELQKDSTNFLTSQYSSGSLDNSLVSILPVNANFSLSTEAQLPKALDCMGKTNTQYFFTSPGSCFFTPPFAYESTSIGLPLSVAGLSTITSPSNEIRAKFEITD